MCVKANIEMLSALITSSLMTHLMNVYFHTCQNHFYIEEYKNTTYFRKMLSFEMHFYQTFGFIMFKLSKKKRNLILFLVP